MACLPVVAIDTEYDEKRRPFLATATDQQLHTKVYRLEYPSERHKLQQLCEDRKIRKVFHQLSADKTALLTIGIRVLPPYEDTMIMAALLIENYLKLGLKELARMFLGEGAETQAKLKTVINQLKRKAKKENRMFSWRDIPLDVIIPYAKDDPLYTIKLYFLWKDEIKKYQTTYRFEKSLIPIIVKMQIAGVMIDRAFVKKQMRFYIREMRKIYEKMRLISHIEFNPRSPKQLPTILLRLGAPLQKENKTGFSTDASVLQELAVQRKVRDRAVGEEEESYLHVPKIVNIFTKMILDYRFYHKHLSTYYRPLLHKYTTESNPIGHFDFYQSGAKTGRFSAELFQTFPRSEESRRTGKVHEVRRCVMVPPNELIVAIDCDQIEMRLFGHYSQSRRLIHAFEVGLDPYVQIARDLFSQTLMESSKVMHKALRWVGKKIALGIIYGMGVKKMIRTLLFELPNVVDRKTVDLIGMDEYKARKILYTFHRLYPVRQHSNSLRDQIWYNGELVLDIESPLMSIHRVYTIPADKAYKAINVEIQGTAAYFLKAAMKRVVRTIKKSMALLDANTRIIGTVHDELLFYMTDGAVAGTSPEYRIRRLMGAMEDYVTFRVPITVSAKVSNRSWGEVLEWDRKQPLRELLPQ